MPRISAVPRRLSASPHGPLRVRLGAEIKRRLYVVADDRAIVLRSAQRENGQIGDLT